VLNIPLVDVIVSPRESILDRARELGMVPAVEQATSTAYAAEVELGVFDEVSELVRALTPDDLGTVHVRAHRRGVKVWFGPAVPPKEHYEAQLLSRRYVDGTDGMAIEIGFHAEHRDLDANAAVIDRVSKSEDEWRSILGDEPEIAPFYGADNWRRVSEAWIEPDLDDPEIAFEVASRLVDYLAAIEAARRA